MYPMSALEGDHLSAPESPTYAKHEMRARAMLAGSLSASDVLAR